MDLGRIIETIILAIVEGITEFLPISSTGHMIIVSDLFSIKNDAFNRMYMVVVQLAAILAVIVLYWPRLWKIAKGFFTGDKQARHFVGVWIVACIPAGLMGVLLDDIIETYLFSTVTVVVALVIGALMMFWGERKISSHNTEDELMDITYKQALTVGVSQCMSLMPGFSRSASTIMGGWASGLTTAAAADFSFFLAIPIMFAASGYSLLKFFKDDTAVAAIGKGDVIALVLGCIAAFVVAWIVVKSFLSFLKSKPLRYFAWYRLALALALIVLLAVGIIR